MTPDVGAVLGDEDRDVADDLNAVAMRIRLERVPLLGEQPLEILLVGRAVGQLPRWYASAPGSRKRISRGQPCQLPPPKVAFSAMNSPIVGQPVGVLLTERRRTRLLICGAVRPKMLITPAEQTPACSAITAPKSTRPCGKLRHIKQRIDRQQTRPDQALRADQQRIAGEGGEGLVGGVAVAGRARAAAPARAAAWPQPASPRSRTHPCPGRRCHIGWETMSGGRGYRWTWESSCALTSSRGRLFGGQLRLTGEVNRVRQDPRGFLGAVEAGAVLGSNEVPVAEVALRWSWRASASCSSVAPAAFAATMASMASTRTASPYAAARRCCPG